MMNLDFLVDGARLYLVIFARIAALLQTSPVFSSSAIPLPGRVMMMFFVSIIFYSFVGNSYGPLPEDGLGYAFVIVTEILLGILMGLFLQIILAVFITAGQFFSFQMGFGASQVFDPLAQVEIPLIGQFLNLMGLAVFLSIDSMQKIFLNTIAASFRVMKGTDLLASGAYLKNTLVHSIGGLFEQALLLSFPVLGTLILISVTMGLFAKAAPQMNLLMVGFPIQIGVGFIILLLATPFIAEKMSHLFQIGFEMIDHFLIQTERSLR